MSSLSTDTIFALLALLFCLPQLILSTLTWYEGRHARLRAIQCEKRCSALCFFSNYFSMNLFVLTTTKIKTKNAPHTSIPPRTLS
ncbi:hypothetical protein F4810DRAFT_682863 [Camillea tinctor]|nr:hypothetical protein F4810DRAFT_682863 [Camillea tinctor]